MENRKLTQDTLEIIESFTVEGYTLNEVKQIFEIHNETIKQKKSEIVSEKKEKEKQAMMADRILWAAGVSGSNIYSQLDNESQHHVSTNALADEISKTVEDLKKGDTSTLLEMLVGNITQLNLFNGEITRNLTGEVGKQLDNFNKLSNMQLKVMQETRKSIMAINEIINPKRTTFIKEANQHNHLHQISEKKDESQNELQKHLEKPDEIVDASIYVSKEKENEKK